MQHTNKTIPFLVIFSLFLVLANAVLFSFISLVFQIHSSFGYWLLGILLGVLSVSFVIATVLGQYFYNEFTRLYYTISAAWIGFFLYFFFAAFLYGLWLKIDGLAMPLLASLLFVAALGFSLYGFLHARKPRVRTVKLVIKNVPEAWHGRHLIWVSDVHLGQRNGAHFATRVVNAIQKIQHDIVIIGGDLFDGTNAPDPSLLAEPFSQLHPSHGYFYITGNHEYYGSVERFLEAVRKTGATILNDEAVTIDAVSILGVDYKSTAKVDDFKLILSEKGSDAPVRILLKHEPRHLHIAEEAGITLHLSGHTHRGQMWPVNILVNIMYSGFGYGLHQCKKMEVFTSSGVGTWGPPLRVGTRPEIVDFIFE